MSALIPVFETGAFSFLAENPAFNGAGIRVAILDTGVDPGASGLQRTPAGLPKVIELVDATGSGDVGMATRTRSKDGGSSITGLSLRPLLLNPAWDNPSGEFRVGLKAAFELFPRELLRRVRAERASADRTALAPALGAAQIAAGCRDDPDGEFAARAALLEALSAGPGGGGGGDDDAGFAIDVVSFKDGAGVWRVVVDTVGDGDLRAARALAPFSVAQEWGTFGGNTLLNFGVGVHNDGDVVSIVCDAGAHGTHVAGIVAAWHPGSPHLNGVAPGAQIIGIKIGDTRIGSMETGAGLIRGIAAAVAAGAHVINMSYGEPSGRPNVGRFLEKARAAVLEKGVAFFASAGNAGPALSTVGAPGGNSAHIIGVGAAVTSAMMDEQYALCVGCFFWRLYLPCRN
jgi:tripeptidyl-peptidase-2